MPIYEYKCPNCQYVEEKLFLSSEKPKRPLCPRCGQAKMDKIMSSGSFRLKGSGWYATDYGKKESGKEKRDDSS